MPRAYTKSGSVEKYESAEWLVIWSGDANAIGTITGPDSNGNYTVNAPVNYYASKSSGSVCCTTNYGGKEAKYYFVKLSGENAVGDYNIWFRTSNGYVEAMFSIYINFNISSVGRVDVSLNVNIYWEYENSMKSGFVHVIKDFHYTISSGPGQKLELLYSLGSDPNIINTSYDIIEISIT